MKRKFFSKFRALFFCGSLVFALCAISSCKSTNAIQVFDCEKNDFSSTDQKFSPTKNDFLEQKIILDLCNFDEEEIYFLPQKQSGARYSQISQDWYKSEESSVKFSFSKKDYENSQFFTEDFCGENWSGIFMIKADFFNSGKSPVLAEFILETKSGNLFFTEEKKLTSGENLDLEFYLKDLDSEKNSSENQFEVKKLYLALKSPEKYSTLYMDNLRIGK